MEWSVSQSIHCEKCPPKQSKAFIFLMYKKEKRKQRKKEYIYILPYIPHVLLTLLYKKFSISNNMILRNFFFFHFYRPWNLHSRHSRERKRERQDLSLSLLPLYHHFTYKQDITPTPPTLPTLTTKEEYNRSRKIPPNF